MRVICDAPGQTCNRLWTYVASVAECIAKHKRMVIIFYDWTIEDFPNLLHAPFISFPLWQPWFLRLPKGWGWYKHITWKVTHNKCWDTLFRLMRFTKGWQTRSDTRYLDRTKKQLQDIFRPKDTIAQKAEDMVDSLRRDSDLVVGMHIRRGDYATWHDGRFFYSLDDYHQFMLRIQRLYADRRVSSFISTNEDFPVDRFEGCRCRRFGQEPSGAILDLHTLSLCDLIAGPVSSFSRWASFIGDVPLCFLESRDQQFTTESFSPIADFFHFRNGKEIADW